MSRFSCCTFLHSDFPSCMPGGAKRFTPLMQDGKLLCKKVQQLKRCGRWSTFTTNYRV